MENLSNSIANKIALELNLNNDKKEVIAYGTFALLQTVLSIFLTITLGYLFHVAIEATIILFTVSILRKYSGGAHASSPGNCTSIGLIICMGQAILISLIVNIWAKINITLILVLMIFIWSYYIIYKLAPVDTPSKPINKENTKNLMKKNSIIVLNIYFIMALAIMTLYFNLEKSRFLVYALCISGGVAWQTFTLTKCGHSLINKIDVFFIHIIKEVRK